MQPTRIMGRPWQKCRTSEIHCAGCQCAADHATGRAAYLLLDVIEGVGRVDGKADEDDVRIGVGEGSETVVVLLAGGIPEGELDVLAVDLDIGDVVLKDGGNVDLCRACQ